MAHIHKKQKLSYQQQQQQPTPAGGQQQDEQQSAAGIDYRSLGLRLHADSPFISYVFVKRHKPHAEEADIPNALYVTGLPLGLDQASLEAIFQLFGGVADVVMHPSRVSRTHINSVTQ